MHRQCVIVLNKHVHIESEQIVMPRTRFAVTAVNGRKQTSQSLSFVANDSERDKDVPFQIIENGPIKHFGPAQIIQLEKLLPDAPTLAPSIFLPSNNTCTSLISSPLKLWLLNA